MQLETEGFSGIEVVSIRPGDIPPEPHTHEQDTVHIILKGTLTIIDTDGTTNVYEQGDRVDFPAGTKHSASVGPEGMKMMVGVKK